jgi:hypothetical protein
MCFQAKGSGALHGEETLWIAAYYPQPTGPPKQYYLESMASFTGNRWIADYIHVGGEGDNNRPMGVVAFLVKDKSLRERFSDQLKSEKTAISKLPAGSHPIDARVIRTTDRGCA